MNNFATDKNRWIALIFLAVGLAIVIIDNTVLNVAIPYILRDLGTSLDAIQWVISGYALIIATLLITMGRLGDLFGRRKIFRLGIILFAVGSFIASISRGAGILFLGEALIEAIGASAMLTSSLSLLVSEFHGRERALAFGVWGSVAGAAAAIGPLLGGYLTTYYSWRWSLRINVIVAVIALLGSVFIKESKSAEAKKFDWLGTVFSGAGLFVLVFAIIEGRKYGWWAVKAPFVFGNLIWPFGAVSIIPFAFGLAAILLVVFIYIELKAERHGRSPILKLSMFRNSVFSIGLLTLGVIVLAQLGTFFVLAIYLENVLGLTALGTGFVFLSVSLAILIFGPISGFIASRTNPKLMVNIGMVILTLGLFYLARVISPDATGWSLAPALFVFGAGFGMTSAQLTNVVLSSAPTELAGEASGVNSTVRQVSSSIGVAVIGMIFAAGVSAGIASRVNSDPKVPVPAKSVIINALQKMDVEAGINDNPRFQLDSTVKRDVLLAITDATRTSLNFSSIFVVLGAVISFFIPKIKISERSAAEA